ncbi:MAG: hypothetical protein Q8P50_14470 [Bacillota bacterium]|nr:hypothetical protein [Bacillota bacterium]
MSKRTGSFSWIAADLEGTVKELLYEYLIDHVGEVDPPNALQQGIPFHRDGALYIFYHQFREWLQEKRRMYWVIRHLPATLGSIGAIPEEILVSAEGLAEGYRRTVWRLPPQYRNWE